MTYKGVIFDLDGTLVHSLSEYRCTIVGQTLKDLDRTASNESIDKFWYESNRSETIRHHFKLDPDVFWPVYKQHDSTELREKFTKPYDDVDIVPEIKSRGFKIGIVTGAPPNILELELGMIGKENFDAVVMARNSNGIKEKPSPQGLLQCLDLLELSNNDVIYVGNADEDILSARNANVFDVFIDRKEHEFKHLNPSLTITSLYELRDFLGYN